MIVFRGLARRPVRTALTLGGISIGIAAVVALVGISRGFEKSWGTGMEARGTDIVVNNMSSSLMPTPFDAAARDRIAKLPHVDATSSLLVQLMGVEDASMMIISGREWGGYEWGNLKLVSGRLPRDAAEPAVVLGRNAAEVLKKKIGDPIQIDTRELTVVGIVDGGAWVENGAVILSLPLLQDITGNQNRINIIDIRVAPSTSEAQIKDLCKQIDVLIPEAKA
ncbi:MAG: ABC transporter permease, partial [Chthoniobacterales bacterium]